jgi:DNA mismatch repair ATPase MutS
MTFTIDKQTILDLELKERIKEENSIFSLFNHTKTNGGRNKLDLFFNNPLSDIEFLEQRIQVLKYFQNSFSSYRFDKECFDFIEYYFNQQNIPFRFSPSISVFNAVKNIFRPRNEYYIIQRGIQYLIRALNDFYSSIKIINVENAPQYIINSRSKVLEVFKNTPLSIILELKNRKSLNPLELGKLDFYFRKQYLHQVKDILEIIYEFDAFISVSLAKNKLGFSYPEYSKEQSLYKVKGLFHPFLNNPISNDFEFNPQRNILFLTGPNMAGKSTFLKALSISIYLSHIGFPVPAEELTTSIFNGLITTINLPDNINKGYSHFYNEVLRVKYVAEKINQSGNLFIIFDEIFRGTNVKDAYEASLAVIAGFSKLNNSFFAISTHIIEVGEELKSCPSIIFKNFEANLIEGKPNYTFKLNDGITNERIGMYILKKEKILELIECQNNIIDTNTG